MHSLSCWFVATLANSAVNYRKGGRIEKAIELPVDEEVLKMETYLDPLTTATGTCNALLHVLEYQLILASTSACTLNLQLLNQSRIVE